MQGKPNRGVPGHPRARLIPAHAGKTLISNGEIPKGRAHPRSCGENVMSHAARLRRWGASPLTRGKLRAQDGSADHLGLIPAHAGKTTRNRYPQFHTKAHPRSRGENPTFAAIVSKAAGSSPLTRGKPFRALLIRPRFRLIPAHTGKTGRACFRSRLRPAHPRSRGENSSSAYPSTASAGSSPLTRGKLRLGGRLDAVVGLIPAHAGKTRPSTSPRPRFKAHSRSCGENAATPVFAMPPSGSSPLTRGKRQVLGRGRQIRRFIPAHAGKTLHDPAHRSASKAHPRSRGENVVADTKKFSRAGSSPLTRGKLNERLEDATEGRLIPAHAGKTVNC